MIRAELDQLLDAVVKSAAGVSDLVFVAGRPLQIEVAGSLRSFTHPQIPGNVLSSERIQILAEAILDGNGRLLAELKEHGSCDCSYTLKNSCRFRVNVYMQNGTFAMVLRHLKPLVPTIQSLNLAPAFREITQEQDGIVFVTGGTGVGKTTTMAAMLNEINQTREVHIVTLEDPIEFLINPVKATFSQRELGRDFFSFHKGMRAAMRQAPKVIFIGEIRDRETMETVLKAGETGHLVFSTLHTTSASMTVNRIIGMFSSDEEPQIRERLAASLRSVISQRLVPAISGPRYLATELMGNNLRTREAILLGENETRRFESIIEASNVNGWHTFEHSLYKAYEQGIITADTAKLYASNRMKMVQRIDSRPIVKPRAVSDTDATLVSLSMAAGRREP